MIEGLRPRWLLVALGGAIASGVGIAVWLYRALGG